MIINEIISKVTIVKKGSFKKNNQMWKLRSNVSPENPNPKICLYCGNEFYPKNGKQIRGCNSKKWKETKFCTRSCAASYNNKKYPKILKGNGTICSCGEKKGYKANFCLKCFNKKWKERTLQDVVDLKYKGSLKWVYIRNQARSLMEQWKIPKKCEKCGWNKHVEVNHIKKISDFPLNTLISEVNSRDNLHYLCPNCHWEFENNKAV